MNLEENPQFSPSHWWIWKNWNIKETTGLLIWSQTIGTQTHAYTHTFIEILILLKNYSFWTFRTFLLYVLIFYKLKQQAKRPQNSPPQRPDPSQVAVVKRLQEFTIEGDPWTWLKWHKTDTINAKELNVTIETARKCKERPNPVTLLSIEYEKLGFFTRNHCSCVTLAPKYHYLLQKSWI